MTRSIASALQCPPPPRRRANPASGPNLPHPLSQNYVAFEEWINPILDAMLKEQKEDGTLWTPSKMIRRLGKEIDNEESVYYWAYKVRVREGAVVWWRRRGAPVPSHGSSRRCCRTTSPCSARRSRTDRSAT